MWTFDLVYFAFGKVTRCSMAFAISCGSAVTAVVRRSDEASRQMMFAKSF